MKLLGVEFRDFACFERQFVPIRAGLNLLVGRNNAGKTALLRGLSALAALPIGASVPPVPTDLSGYLRPNVTNFSFDIVCGIEDSERSFFENVPDSSWVAILADGVARWRFTTLTVPRQVSFLHLALVTPDPGSAGKQREAVVIEADGSGRAFSKRLRYGDLANIAGTPLASRTFGAEGGRQSPIFDRGKPTTSVLEQYANVKLISPHRVVVSRQMLQTALDMPGDGQNLSQFLMTLHGRDRDTFEAIEGFVTKVFPEFKHVNLVPSDNNQLLIDLTERTTNRRIALENCGTGVEQVLTLATFILTTKKPGLVLLDEPHSYLHPTAERALVQFLGQHAEHSYVVSTHSAVLMNSVEPDRITHVSPPGHGYTRSREAPETSRILFDLGYRNSDSMFNDRLILVEGPSDRKIIPILLLNSGQVERTQIDRTGFPLLEGTDKGARAVQSSILRYEKLLGAIGRGDQPRTYVFDGDRKDDEKGFLLGTNSPITGERISAAFLPRLEIENYLLVPEAIASAIREELILKGEPREVSTQEVQTSLGALLQGDDARLFPQGRKAGGNPLAEIKGSRALERLYEQCGLPYHKEKSGVLIAKFISAKSQPALSEITALVRPLFARR